MKKEFYDRIYDFNTMYGLSVAKKPTLPTLERLENFKKILQEELNEIDDIITDYKTHEKTLDETKKIELLTNISDWLGDMVVYLSSEAVKYGIDLNQTLDIIMDSNFSKLDNNGKPIYDERGKVLKGPNYWKPEPKIKDHLINKSKE
jgi:predicted HAD superfamily Cof-like phosphohydrolase